MPCPELARIDSTVMVFDGGSESRVTVVVDIVEGELEYFVAVCVRDVAGCQHIRTRGATALLLAEKINRALRLTFEVVEQRRGSRQGRR